MRENTHANGGNVEPFLGQRVVWGGESDGDSTFRVRRELAAAPVIRPAGRGSSPQE
jgi:hypothetical protein